MPQGIQHHLEKDPLPFPPWQMFILNVCVHLVMGSSLSPQETHPMAGDSRKLESFPHFLSWNPSYWNYIPGFSSYLWQHRTGLLLLDKKNVEDVLSAFLEIVISLSYPTPSYFSSQGKTAHLLIHFQWEMICRHLAMLGTSQITQLTFTEPPCWHFPDLHNNRNEAGITSTSTGEKTKIQAG